MPDAETRARLVPWSAMTLLSCVFVSYALLVLLSAAVNPRNILPAGRAAGVPFHDAHQVVAWACWVPNLIVAEWWILTSHHREATA